MLCWPAAAAVCNMDGCRCQRSLRLTIAAGAIGAGCQCVLETADSVSSSVKLCAGCCQLLHGQGVLRLGSRKDRFAVCSPAAIVVIQQHVDLVITCSRLQQIGRGMPLTDFKKSRMYRKSACCAAVAGQKIVCWIAWFWKQLEAAGPAAWLVSTSPIAFKASHQQTHSWCSTLCNCCAAAPPSSGNNVQHKHIEANFQQRPVEIQAMDGDRLCFC
jgi:hypothetical protein